SDFASLSSYDILQKKLKGERLLTPKENNRIQSLQSNDLVYVPTKEERQKIVSGTPVLEAIDAKDLRKVRERLYVVNDFSKTDIYFRPNSFSKAIKSKELHTSFDEKCSRFVNFYGEEDENVLIKDVCVKMRFDRIGNIVL